MDAGIAHIVRSANFVPGVEVVDGMSNRRMDENSLKSTLWFSLLRFSARETKIWFELVVGSLISHAVRSAIRFLDLLYISSTGEKDLLNINP